MTVNSNHEGKENGRREEMINKRKNIKCRVDLNRKNST
ncbi:hypothetical protein EVA_06803 [gut metagenome]|uniref:Uncharacterized protein n=1 Tax=gut metagenome TaxID=749906 RepID=J9GDX4_9ZZZZ